MVDPADVDVSILPQLRTLDLGDLSKLSCMWNKNPRGVTLFQNLTSLVVVRCYELVYLFTPAMARAAAKLTEIFVGGGDMMKAIIMDESEEQARDMESTIGFPHLKVLTIKDCPRMMGFYTCLRVHTPAFSRTSCCGHKEEVAPEQETQARVFFNDKVLLPNLEELKLTEVGYFEQIWVNELPETSFAKLTSISIFGLHRISSVFPVTLAEKLQNLEHVSISCCSSVETLFEPFAHDSKDKHKAIMLPKVKTLSLRVLQKLKHLVDKFFRISVGFPSLIEISVEKCHQLVDLIPFATATTLSKLEILVITNCKGMEEVVSQKDRDGDEVDEIIFPRLHDLQMGDLDRLICFSSGSCSFVFPSLRKLSICKFPKMKAFILRQPKERSEQLEDAFFNEKVNLPNLEDLLISEVKVEEMWHWEIPTGSFLKLKLLEVVQCAQLVRIFPSDSDTFRKLWSIKVSSCQNLTNVFPVSVAKNLGRLQLLCVDECELIEHVVAEGNIWREADKFVELTELTSLTLKGLQNLSRFCQWNYTLEMPSLNKLDIENCGGLEEIWEHLARSIKLALPSLSLENLTSLEVSNCHVIKAVMTIPVARSLKQLREMSIKECNALSEVVGNYEYGGGSPEEIAFERLKYLSLESLMNITQFFSGSHILIFPSLISVRLEQCPVMKIFSQGDVVAPKLEQFETSWRFLEHKTRDLNANVEHCFSKKYTLEPIKSLKLSESPDWREIWLGHLPSWSFKQLESLTIEDWGSLSRAIPFDKMLLLSNLKFLEVRNCAVVEVFESPEANEPADKIFLDLCDLCLRDLPNLRLIFPDQDIQKDFSFSCLVTIKVHNCRCLSNLLTPTTAQDLPCLQVLEIKDCHEMKQIIAREKEWEEVPQYCICFPGLESLVLESLSALMSFYPGDYILDCPSLAKITINNCPNMNSFTCSSLMDNQRSRELSGEIPHEPFFCEKVRFPRLKELILSQIDKLGILWNDHQLYDESFRELKAIKVECSKELSIIFPRRIMKRFILLETLSIANCPSLQVVFDLSGREALADCDSEISMAMPLRELNLSHLQNLRSVWYAEPEAIVNFENLEQVHVSGCPELEYLFPASMAQRLWKLCRLSIEWCGLQGIIAKIEKESPRFFFPSITFLKLWGLPKLEAFYPGLHSTAWCGLIELVVYRCDRVQTFASECQSFSKALVDGHHEILVKPPLFLVDQDEFCSLETVSVVYNEMMKEMWGGQFPAEFFPKLKSLEIKNNDFKPAIFTRGVLQWLHHLQKLFLSRCCFEEIDLLERPAAQNQDKTSTGTVSRLRKLKLKLLPGEQELRHEEPVDLVASQHLEVLQVSICPGFTGLDQLALSFQVLMVLEVSVCHESLYLMTSSMARSLTQLTRMIVADCNNMKEIVIDNEVSEGGNEIAFERLEQLTLHSLPNLESFCSGNFPLKFPSLTEVTLTECPQMECFSCGALRTPLLAEVHVAGSTIFFPNRNLNASLYGAEVLRM
ncbi:uncharacterized protein LOC116213823 [Punica granatum]|uniref:Uncharacterized protein LOC116213823 n=1 Tax=Punica granatum TaxID=22663 RepID=A0A6P8ECM1_PUNGR|nr:uncharacterized protein LOC116213823 [Punica granatum]